MTDAPRARAREGRAASAVLARARPAGGPAGRVRARSPAARVDASAPLWERAFLVGALLAQQDAFLNLARIARGADSADPTGELATTDPLNSALVFLTLIGLAALTVAHRRAVWDSARRNGLSLALLGLAFLSVVWSVDAGLTGKRAVVYAVAVWLPVYLAGRFGFDGAVRLMAAAFAIAAVASFAIGAAVPSLGVMHTLGLDGAWRGVFAHKNSLAESMRLGALLEAYLALAGPRRRLHGGLMTLELLLVVLSRSTTGLVVTGLALAVLGADLLLRRGGQVRRLFTFAAPLALAAAAAVVLFAPRALEQASGKDATLSGRTELWAEVAQAIGEKPFTGWGFQAFWQPGNARAQDIWDRIGWTAPNGHNGFLDVALGLGPLGLLLTAAVVLQGFVRGGRLLGQARTHVAGAATLVVLGAVLIASFTEAIFVRQGAIDWLVLNLLSFTAAQLWAETRPGPADALPSPLARARPTPRPAAGGRLPHPAMRPPAVSRSASPEA